MNLERKWPRIAAVAVLTLAAAVAVVVVGPHAASAYGGFAQFGNAEKGGDLADALGITAEQLTEAQAAVAEKSIDQAVKDGWLGEEMAKRIRESGAQADGRLGRMGHFGRFSSGADTSALLAEELGVSVEELEEAQATVADAALDQLVEDGRITEEQAETMRAMRGLRSYMDEAGVHDRMMSVREEAVEQAVEDGVITHEQADQVLQGGGFGFRGRGSFGFHGKGGSFGHGGKGGCSRHFGGHGMDGHRFGGHGEDSPRFGGHGMDGARFGGARFGGHQFRFGGDTDEVVPSANL